jgi:hypothetical protein
MLNGAQSFHAHHPIYPGLQQPQLKVWEISPVYTSA